MYKIEDIQLKPEVKQLLQDIIDKELLSIDPTTRESVFNNKIPTPEELLLDYLNNKSNKIEISIGKLSSQLVEYRLSHEYDIESVSKLIGISEKILKDIESGNLDYLVDIYFNLLQFYDNDYFNKYTLIK